MPSKDIRQGNQTRLYQFRQGNFSTLLSATQSVASFSALDLPSVAFGPHCQLAPEFKSRDTVSNLNSDGFFAHSQWKELPPRRYPMLSNKVKEIMTREVITAETSSTVIDVMELMAVKNVAAVVITEKQTPVGIFTEQDVLKRVMQKRLDPKVTRIKTVMTTPVRAVSEKVSIVDMLGRMYKGKFRHLLIRGEKSVMVGVVSMRDVLKFAVDLGRGLPETQTIGSIMSRELVTVEADQLVDEVIKTMNKEKTDCVIVLSNGSSKGIFTERDLLRRVAVKSIDTRKAVVKDVMTPELVTMAESALVGEVLAEMYKDDFRNMPIRGDREDLVGIVAMGDVLKYAKALDVDENVRKAWKEIEDYWDSDEHYTPG